MIPRDVRRSRIHTENDAATSPTNPNAINSHFAVIPDGPQRPTAVAMTPIVPLTAENQVVPKARTNFQNSRTPSILHPSPLGL